MKTFTGSVVLSCLLAVFSSPARAQSEPVWLEPWQVELEYGGMYSQYGAAFGQHDPLFNGEIIDIGAAGDTGPAVADLHAYLYVVQGGAFGEASVSASRTFI